MTVLRSRARLLSGVLVVAFFATAVAAALVTGPTLAPDAAAATNCPYSKCTDSSIVSLPAIEAIIGLLALVALVLGVLIWRDRRRPPRTPPPEWADAGPAAAAPAAAGGAALYTETPEDVSAPPPEMPTTPSSPADGDIDSLMAELDRISGEILKPGAKGKPPAGGSSDPAGTGGDSDSGS